MIQRRSLAVGTVLALGLGGLFATTPALAQESPPPESAQDPLALAAEIVAQHAGNADGAITGYGATSAGDPIILVDKAFRDAAFINEIVEEHGVESLALIDKPVPLATNELVGGAGYLRPSDDGYVYLCSTGFAAWTPTGDPAVLTAGHCSDDGAGTDVFRSLPSIEPAHTGVADQPVSTLDETRFGTWGFSQFGGPGNSTGADGSPNSTDIGVIDLVDANITALPAVTDWSTAASDDLAASTTPIRGIAAPTSGELSKSGRTTGVTSGSTTVELLHEDGIRRPVEILDGYMEVGDRWVRGFIGGQLSAGGDSGGAVFQGDQAVGVVSGGPSDDVAPEDDFTWATRLVDALDFTDGYTVMLDIEVPGETNLGAGGSVDPGDDIIVQMPSNATTLRVSESGAEVGSFDVVDGSARFAAPATNGTYTYSLTATNGFSESASVDITFEVKKTTPRPELLSQDTTAASGATTAEITIGGTGLPGATVTVTGLNDGREATATVEADSTWQLTPEPFPIGVTTVFASQSVDGEGSAASSATVTVVPAAPRITSIAPDQAFGDNAGPSEISGEGLPGATVSMSVTPGDSAADSPVTVNEEGSWTAPIAANASGEYVATVTQTLSQVTSAPATVAFSVGDKLVDPTVPPGPTDPGTPTDPKAPGGPSPDSPDGFLPLTGGLPVMPLILGATAVALLGAGVLFYVGRRKSLLLE